MEGGQKGLVLEKLEGVHMHELHAHEHEVFREGLLDAVERLHDVGVLHGDLRSANILFNRDRKMVCTSSLVLHNHRFPNDVTEQMLWSGVIAFGTQFVTFPRIKQEVQ